MVLPEPFGRIEARTTYGKVPPRKRPALGRRYRPEQDFSSGLCRRDDRRTGTPDPCSAALYGRVLKARGGSANICNSRVVGKPEVILMVPSGLVTTSPSDVSEARIGKACTGARCVCALSIHRLEGSRPWLRRTRALWELNGVDWCCEGTLPGLCGRARQTAPGVWKVAGAKTCCEQSAWGSREKRFVWWQGTGSRSVPKHAK